MGNLLLARGLLENELQDIRELEEECSRYGNLSMKLNWDMLVDRSIDENNDFLYYDDNKLIGYLGLYGFVSKPEEIEITGMVHPDYRRKGVFKELFNSAKQECMDRGVERLLLIVERSSEAGTSFLKFIGSRYSFSEYRMKFNEATVPIIPNIEIAVRKTEARDYPELVHFDSVCYGLSIEEAESKHRNDAYSSTYIAELKGEIIGKISASMEREAGYIFGFCIKPEYRGRGYGRQLLSLTLLKLLSEQIKTVLLEVEVKNENALLLYKSCGFKELTVYDYYELIL